MRCSIDLCEKCFQVQAAIAEIKESLPLQLPAADLRLAAYRRLLYDFKPKIQNNSPGDLLNTSRVSPFPVDPVRADGNGRGYGSKTADLADLRARQCFTVTFVYFLFIHFCFMTL